MQISHFDNIIDRIEADERTGYIGPTRCGKSTALAAQLKHYDNVLLTVPKRIWTWDLQPIGDPKAEERQQKRFGIRTYDTRELDHELVRVARDGSGDPVVYLPPLLENEQAHQAMLDYPFRKAMERGNTLAATDDLYFHGTGTNFRSRAPNFFLNVTAGSGLGNGTAYAFQRPVWVPKVALSETEHFMVWYLADPDDRDTVNALCGDKGGKANRIDWQTLLEERWSFVYFERGGKVVSQPIILDLEREAA